MNLTGVGVTIARFESTLYLAAAQNVGQAKSPVDDLFRKRGTVSMKVAFVLRSAEVQPLFRDLCRKNSCAFSPRITKLNPPQFFCYESSYFINQLYNCITPHPIFDKQQCCKPKAS